MLIYSVYFTAWINSEMENSAQTILRVLLYSRLKKHAYLTEHLLAQLHELNVISFDFLFCFSILSESIIHSSLISECFGLSASSLSMINSRGNICPQVTAEITVRVRDLFSLSQFFLHSVSCTT